MFAKAEIDRLKHNGDLGKLTYVRILMPAGDWVANGFCDLISTDDPTPKIEPDEPTNGDGPYGGFEDPYIHFVNFYIHQINLLRYLIGEPYKVTYADPSGAMLAAVSQSGVAGVIEMSPYQTTVDWQESAFVAFERGYVKLELPAPLAFNRPGKVEVFSDPGHGATPSFVVPQLPWVHAMRQQAFNFVSAIKGEMNPMCGAQEAQMDLVNAREYINLKG